ncbi:uncharacterized protein KZ484_011118 [Pholidichthys leucotaenia]
MNCGGQQYAFDASSLPYPRRRTPVAAAAVTSSEHLRRKTKHRNRDESSWEQVKELHAGRAGCQGVKCCDTAGEFPGGLLETGWPDLHRGMRVKSSDDKREHSAWFFLLRTHHSSGVGAAVTQRPHIVLV